MPADNDRPKNPPRVAESAQPAYQREYEPEQQYDPAVAGLHAVGRLQKAEFTPKQAESMVLAMRELVGDLATKHDIALLKGDIERLEAQMATKDDLVELKTEMAEFKGELKTEFAEFKSEIKTELASEIAGVRGDLKAEIAGLRSETAAEFASVRNEIKSEIAGLRSEFTGFKSETAAEFAGVKNDLRTEMKGMETRLEKSISKSILWAVGINFVGVLGVVGIAAAILIAVMQRMLAG